MPFPELLSELASDVLRYKLGFGLTVLQWASIGLRAVRGRASPRPASTAASNPYWFLAVFGWGVDSAVLVARLFTGDIPYYPSALWSFMHAAVALGVLLTLLASSLAAERVARTAGLAARRLDATVPLPVLAAIVSGGLVWALAFVMVLPIPRQRDLSLGSRMPCLPDESVDDGTGRVLTGCRFWNGGTEYFVAPEAVDAMTVGYLDVANAGVATPEGVGVGSRLNDVLLAGGTKPVWLGRRLCASTLPSGWRARFDASTCGEGSESGSAGPVRRLVHSYWRR
jgi:hypothetical protein